MWFHDIQEIPQIAKRAGTSIFVMPNDIPVDIKNAIIIQPGIKTVITIDQVKEALGRLNLKQSEDQFVIIRPADKLGLDAANTLLKNLEEPGEYVHFVLITEMPSKLLPTILSRATIYFLRNTNSFKLEIDANDKEIEFAKKLIAGKPTDLVDFAENTAKKKSARDEALKYLSLAIEILEKSYFITNKEMFIRKIPKFLKAYENINKNGHVKLHLVADLC